MRRGGAVSCRPSRSGNRRPPLDSRARTHVGRRTGQPGEGRSPIYWPWDFPAPRTQAYGRTAALGELSAHVQELVEHGVNVWEWTTDWYGADTRAGTLLRGAGSYDPRRHSSWSGARSIKGGFVLFADNTAGAKNRPRPRRPGRSSVETVMSPSASLRQALNFPDETSLPLENPAIIRAVVTFAHRALACFAAAFLTPPAWRGTTLRGGPAG